MAWFNRKVVIMISSLIWLLLIKLGVIDPIHAPWEVYIPSLIFEAIMYCIFIPKVLDKLDEWRKRK